jgi:sialidase-1
MYRSLVLFLAACAGAGAVNTSAVNVFVSGDEISEGIKQYRIPALVRTPKGTLLAFAEARTHPETDCGYKWLVVRRSVDEGASWSSSIDVTDRSQAAQAAGNPMAVYVPATGRVLVTYGVRNLPAQYCSPGDGVFVVDDGGTDGLSWSVPRNISHYLAPMFGGVVPGPGAGIVLELGPYSGRIVFSGSSGIYTHDIVYYSDDNGYSWRISAPPLVQMDESSVVQLANGSLMITLRNAVNNGCNCQAYSISSDAGATWGGIQYDAVLTSPECEASVMRYNQHVYFANPTAIDTRANITIRRSLPNSITWQPAAYVVAPGLTWGAYTSMAQGVVARDAGTGAEFGGIVFERNVTIAGNDTDVISFALFPLEF